MEIENYCVMKEDSLTGLQTRIRDLLSKGWVPQGGITIQSGTYSDRFYQAMIKPKPPEKEKHVTI